MRKILIMIILLLPTPSFAQNISDYLMLQDIGQYRISKPEKLIPGFPPIGGPRAVDSAGVIAGTGHFPDHVDKTYEVMYLGGDANVSPTVQVTQHAGSDSDKWLLHEVESGYRDSDKMEETLDTNVQIRTIAGSNIYFIGIYGGKSYTWVSSNNIVTKISCSSCPKTKPEPLQIVQAYMQKFPSTITLTEAEAKSRAHNEQWIKDEMDRRLWLCDKWFAQYQLGKVERGKVLNEAVDHMNVFLDYREKYYGIGAKGEKMALDNYLQQKDEASIKNRLTGYKTWWSANKTGAINLP